MQSPVNTGIAVDLALTFSSTAQLVFRRYLKLLTFGFVNFSCDCFGNKLHKEKCLVKSCGMTWSPAYINKFINSRSVFVSEPDGFFFLLSFFVFEQFCNAVHIQDPRMDLCICTGPVFEEDQDLRACSNPRSILWLLWFWCLSSQRGSEHKPRGSTGAGWTECQAEVHLF